MKLTYSPNQNSFSPTLHICENVNYSECNVEKLRNSLKLSVEENQFAVACEGKLFFGSGDASAKNSFSHTLRSGENVNTYKPYTNYTINNFTPHTTPSNFSSQATENGYSSTLRPKESFKCYSNIDSNSFSPIFRYGENVKNRSNEKTNKYCNNCGKQGHLYSQCKVPITSYGVIAFRYNPFLKENEYLMVCRQNSFGFIDFMRGKYSIYNKHYISNMVAQMTIQEKKDLVTMEFDDLWRKLWKLPSLDLSELKKYSEKGVREDRVLMDFTESSVCKSNLPSYVTANESSSTLYSRESLNFCSSDSSAKNVKMEGKSKNLPQKINETLKCRKNEEMSSKEKFNALRNGVYVYPSYSTLEDSRDFSSLLSGNLKLNLPLRSTANWSSSTLRSEEFFNSPTTLRSGENVNTEKRIFFSLYSIIDEYVLGEQWVEPEWGFPKGRRNYQEKDYDAAIREFKEETGYETKYLKNIQNIFPFEENLVGSNYKSYKHKYYLMSIDYNESLREDDYSNSEISAVKWKTYQQCIDSIRSYNVEKKKLILNIHKCLSKYGLYY